MMLTIAILSGIGFIVSIIKHAKEKNLDVDLLFATILVLSTWESCFPLAIVVICLSVLIGIVGAINN
jgi:hypothetical protein